MCILFKFVTELIDAELAYIYYYLSYIKLLKGAINYSTKFL